MPLDTSSPEIHAQYPVGCVPPLGTQFDAPMSYEEREEFIKWLPSVGIDMPFSLRLEVVVELQQLFLLTRRQ